MTFIDAMQLMRLGYKVKRPNWVGYWYLDMNDLTTVYIKFKRFKTKENSEMITIKLSESEDMYATLIHTQCNDWEVVEEK